MFFYTICFVSFSNAFSVLLPGGGVSIFDSPFARTGKILFKLAVKANHAGDVFPLWGTCLGFEFLSVCGAGGENVISSVDGEDYSVPLNLSDGRYLIYNNNISVQLLIILHN